MKRVFALAALMLLCLGSLARAEIVQISPGVSATHSVAQMSEARANLSAAAAGNRAYFAGGESQATCYCPTVDTYSSTTGQWSQATQLAYEDGKAVSCAVSWGNRVYISSGVAHRSTIFPEIGEYTDRVAVYDSNGTKLDPLYLSQRRGVSAIAATNTKLIVAGGDFNGGIGAWDNRNSGTIDIFDLPSGTRTTATLSQARKSPVGVGVGDQAIIAGGYYQDWPPGHSWFTSAVDIYHESTNTWSTAQLSVARELDDGVSAHGRAYFAGGISSRTPDWGSGYIVHDTVDVYDAGTGLWSVSQLSQARIGLSSVALGDYVFFAGGTNAGMGDTAWTAYSTVDVYNTRTSQWSVIQLSQPRYSLAAVAVGNQVIFAGGRCLVDGAWQYSDAVDIFTLDPVPEPSSLIGLLSGIAGLCGFAVRRRK